MTIIRQGRRIAVVETVAPMGSRPAFARGQLLTAAAYAALLVGAAVPAWWLVLLAAVATTVAELVLLRPATFAAWALERVGFGTVARGLLRGGALVLFAARESTAGVAVATAVAVTILAGGRALHTGAVEVVRHLRRPPIAARGFDLELPPPPGAPPAWSTDVARVAALADLLGAAGLAAAAAGAPSGVPVAGWAVAVALSALGPAVLAGQVLALRRGNVRRVVTDAVRARIASLQPEVVAYLGNGAEWRYQLEMWLATLERMPQRVLVVVRDHEVLRRLAPTSLPVVSVPGGSSLMTLDIPGLRTVLYVGNTANNLHLLRRPGVRSAFIGHGDSDKGASANPFARAYHEIWVAGPAGRDRYAAAGVDLPPSAFVEVGRPQLRELPRRPDVDGRTTVLYAPTWEGWGEDAFHSSLPHLGPDLVRALLDRGDVRVMYRPHPRTGHRDPATRRAHQEVLRLLEAAGARRPTGSAPPPTAGPTAAGDLLDQVTRPAPPWSRAAHDQAVEQWNAAFWRAHPGHRILVAPAPDLHACFERADALIADISSVPNDFLATNRPYAIVNSTDSGPEELQASSATAGGGFVLGRDLRELDALVRAAGGGADPTAAARADARTYVLGPRPADPTERFRQELRRVCSGPNATISA